MILLTYTHVFFFLSWTFPQQTQTVGSHPCFSLWNYRYCSDLQLKLVTYFDVGTQWQHHLGKREEVARGRGNTTLPARLK